MNAHHTARIIASLTIVAALSLAESHDVALAAPPKVGIQQRVPWTTSRVSGTPDAPLPYVTERAFPGLKFDKCLDMTPLPGSNRLIVVEQSGKVYSFPNTAGVKQADLVVDISKDIKGVNSVYAFTLHPDFEKNRYCYVCYIKGADPENGTHIARFKLKSTDPPTIDIASEKTIITWQAGGHNGCCLKFGLDGYLYISTGDAAPPNPPDQLRTGQDISDLLSSILRIDVDNADDGKNYRIPVDNPFVDRKDARGEVWAYGFRNPWRMSFDRKTGDLWVGDVGWELWEMLDRVERGGNYGWGVMEGGHVTNPEWPRGPTPFLQPTIEHPHSESSSITDGLTYYGTRLKKLHGTHIYSDYDTGKLWGFRYEKGQVVGHRELADTTHRVVGFGEDHAGEFYILDHIGGTLHRLIPNPQPQRNNTFPRKLSQSGLFASVSDQVPAAGVIPYSINAQPWADHAVAERFVAVPKDLSVTPTGAAWTFPKDSVLVKTLSLHLVHGEPSSLRRIETQILHFDGSDWRPYSYQWNDEQTDAVLLNSTGGEQRFDVADPTAPNGKRQQTWRFSGRAECQRCHNKWSGPALAFNTAQLNKEHDYGSVQASQLETFAHIGLIAKPPAAKNRPRLVDPYNETADLTDRARGYLQANCAHCHRLHAGGAVLSKMHYDVALKDTKLIGVRPTQGTFGIHAAHVIAPGDPFRSVLYYRMSKLGRGRMPHIASSEVDRRGVDLIYDWIQRLPPKSAKDKTGNAAATRLRREESAGIGRLQQSTSPAQQSKLVDELLSSTSGSLQLLRSIEDSKHSAVIARLAIRKAAAHPDVRVRDLFERFLPADKRIKRLGSVVNAEQLLALPGDLARGKMVVFKTSGVQCLSCHQLEKQGKKLGPDLSSIGKKYSRAQLLESLLTPSKRVDPKYVTYVVETKSGRLFSGLLQKKDAEEVVLTDVQNKQIRIAADQIEQVVPARNSLMPDLLLRDMTAQQAADLLAYLSSLKGEP